MMLGLREKIRRILAGGVFQFFNRTLEIWRGFFANLVTHQALTLGHQIGATNSMTAIGSWLP
jgi:hypothetical protein